MTPEQQTTAELAAECKRLASEMKLRGRNYWLALDVAIDRLESLATSAAPRGAVPLPIIEALNKAAGGNDWQGDAPPSDLMGQAIAAIERLATSAAGEPVAWEYRSWNNEFSSTPGWGEWRRVEPRNIYMDTVADSVREIQAYIAKGYRYELRALHAAPAPTQPAEPAHIAALRSIAANTCCDRCQEAALVARKALNAAPPAPERAERVADMSTNGTKVNTSAERVQQTAGSVHVERVVLTEDELHAEFQTMFEAHNGEGWQALQIAFDGTLRAGLDGSYDSATLRKVADWLDRRALSPTPGDPAA